MGNGKKREIAECNNSTTFPGIGLACILSRARLLTSSMLVSAVKALASQAPSNKDPDAALLPDVEDVRDISVKIAAAVIRQSIEEGLNQEKDIPDGEEELEEWIKEQMWTPRYRELRKVEVEGASREARGEAGSKGTEKIG